MRSITMAEAAQKLPDLIDAAMRGEEILITKDNISVVKLIPANPVKQPRKPGSAKGMVWMSDDFDEPLEDFKEYLNYE
ncbi:MAG: type II toxin-antitoxin system prevent-host-death family antitoxin [Xenococcaceae cyanobacterium MO_188.B32]|nr:type II toxin-antitoxin system prevent-host-death family antitoxin [Xenococcaceae cyanobacterium MO_188.B32]